MITIRVDADFSALTADLKRLQRDQLPFATARALTLTAQDIQSAVKDKMPGEFVLRRQWTVQGIRIKPALKSAWPNQSAVVFSRDPFMNLQETGGTKTSIGRRVFDYGPYLAIPLDARRSKSDVVQKKDWPKNLINPFILTARDGRKYLAVRELAGNKGRVRSIGRTAKGGTWSGTKLMYVLVTREILKPRLNLVAIGQKVAAERFSINFNNAMAKALATAL
jgi:hypothetical protein